MKNKEDMSCSFCGKSQEIADKIIAGMGAYICDECVETCFEILDDCSQENDSTSTTGTAKERNLIPSELVAHLDQYIINQDKAKRTVAVAVYNHYKKIKNNFKKDKDKNADNEVNIKKSNILLLGPSGSGKTYMVETIAKVLDVPFAIADATTLTEAGYVGEDVENVILSLLQAAD